MTTDLLTANLPMDAMDAFGAPALAFGMPGGSEWIILLILGLLIFGRRLPEVGRSLGKGIVEFKRGVKGIEDEIEDESSQSRSSSTLPDQTEPQRLKTGDAPGDAARSAPVARSEEAEVKARPESTS